MNVTLSVVEGPADEREYVFTERATVIVGRSNDCHMVIPSDKEAAATISRHHCLLDINPPNIRVRDFGSLNGTQVNGVEIGRRGKGQTPAEGALLRLPELDLRHGDQVKLGPTLLSVGISGGDEIAATAIPCSRCGSPITGDAVRRDGDLVCHRCRQDLTACVEDLIRKADAGELDLKPISGYELIRELGRGGQGIVFLAKHRKSGSLVALKVLLAEVASSSRAQKQFFREMSSISTLSHPNIVSFHESGESGGQFFFTSDYCDGGSIADVIRNRKSLFPIESSVKLVLQVLQALEYAHTAEVSVPGHTTVRGLVHRDVKPENILLSSADSGVTAKLADFGLAKAFDLAGLSGQTFTGESAGTMRFMSREQLTNFKYSRPAIDVWSTAATLYWMLTAEAPREFLPGADHIRTVLDTSAVPIRERNPNVPARLAAAIDKALIDHPKIKVDSAAAFARSLREAL
ncbi:protein kinase [Rhodococcus sp. IEGM 1366]|uniref:protein kinase domain-containing protein n=1 Tax=Rhodococcus sp. IEGM 1366 TaxID=3082223 RepID=UPI002955B04D|nr:protein kinase [Rhodococcus sp. IEGM 1366]MDV8065581.1 protein kinase [Rhodococcus sp. IEGM 1366]